MGCFEGIVFGLTGGLPRKQVEAMLKSNGASLSTIIHKRVDFVVCTPEAVKSNTQKVRKAKKHGIPLVSQGFLAACFDAKRVVDHHAFDVSTSSKVGQPACTVTQLKTVGDAHEIVGVKRDDVSEGRESVCTEQPVEGKTRSKRRRRRQLDADRPQKVLGERKLVTGTRNGGDSDEGLGSMRKKRLKLKTKGRSLREESPSGAT